MRHWGYMSYVKLMEESHQQETWIGPADLNSDTGGNSAKYEPKKLFDI